MERSLGLAVIVLAALLAASAAADHATSFTFQDIDGTAWVGEDLLGVVVVLFFTATWCEPCRVAEDGLQDLFVTYGSEATFLGVFLPPLNNGSALDAHRQAYGTPWPIGPDQDSMQTRFEIATLPVVFVLRHTGGVGLRWEATGGFTAADVRAAVGNALETSLAEVPEVVPLPADLPWWPPLAVAAAAATIVLFGLRRLARTDEEEHRRGST